MIFDIQPKYFSEIFAEMILFTEYLLKDENIIQTPILIHIKISKK